MPCLNHPDVVDGVSACSRCGKAYCGDCLVPLQGGRFCAACKVAHVKDVKSGVDTADLPLAGIGRRFAAVFVDGLLMMAVFIPLAFATGFFAAAQMQEGREPDAAPQLLFQFIFMALGFVYEGAMLQSRGQTLGKMALGVKVVAPDGGALTPGQAWLRPLVKSLLGFCWLVDYIPAFFRKDKCTVHDMAARTRVIRLTR